MHAWKCTVFTDHIIRANCSPQQKSTLRHKTNRLLSFGHLTGQNKLWFFYWILLVDSYSEAQCTYFPFLLFLLLRRFISCTNNLIKNSCQATQAICFKRWSPMPMGHLYLKTQYCQLACVGLSHFFSKLFRFSEVAVFIGKRIILNVDKGLGQSHCFTLEFSQCILKKVFFANFPTKL